ncbi:MAG: formylglycine-generating enzyme family protein, partial [bacterium]|nr:formylglycine-generating enzyme family protein [bacterium]
GGRDGLNVQIARLEQGFFAARTPVTNAEFARFVEDGGYKRADWWTEAGWEWKQSERKTQPRYWKDKQYNEFSQPVVGVSWYEALAYCRWLVDKVGLPCRLPSEQEWEKAARGYDGREYPWGEWIEGRCNTDESGIGRPLPVGQFSPDGDSIYGLQDIAGNVFEWTASEWNPGSDRRVLRGGAFYNDRGDARCAYRILDDPPCDWDFYGFRLVVSPISPARKPVLSLSKGEA